MGGAASAAPPVPCLRLLEAMIVVRATLHDDPNPVPGRPAALGLDDDLLPVT